MKSLYIFTGNFFIKNVLKIGPTYTSAETEYFYYSYTEKYKYFDVINTFNAGLGYYPNSRTDVSINFNVNTEYVKTKNVSENVVEECDEEYNTSLSA